MYSYATLAEFLAEGLRRFKTRCTMFQVYQWFYFEKFEVYLRAGPMYDRQTSEGKMIFVPAMIVSNLVVKPEFRNQGVFKEFINSLIDQHKNDFKYLVIEQVINPHLAEYLLRNGYKRFADRDLTMYLDLEALR